MRRIGRTADIEDEICESVAAKVDVAISGIQCWGIGGKLWVIAGVVVQVEVLGWVAGHTVRAVVERNRGGTGLNRQNWRIDGLLDIDQSVIAHLNVPVRCCQSRDIADI